MESKITLKIGGMTCASCASVIEHGLKKEKGINSASVNLASEKAYIDFDKENKLFSIPSWLGVKKSLLISKIFHLFTIILLIILSMVYTVGIFYRIGIVFVAGMLFWEHFLLKENNLSNINAAFFNINGYVSIGIFVFILLDKVF